MSYWYRITAEHGKKEITGDKGCKIELQSPEISLQIETIYNNCTHVCTNINNDLSIAVIRRAYGLCNYDTQSRYTTEVNGVLSLTFTDCYFCSKSSFNISHFAFTFKSNNSLLLYCFHHVIILYKSVP